MKRKPKERRQHERLSEGWPSDEELRRIRDSLAEAQRIQNLPPLGGWEGRPEYAIYRKHFPDTR